MAMRRGNRHKTEIDSQVAWLDSLNEEVALGRFIEQYGFSGKWERPVIGIKHAHQFYTPDFELAIADGKRTSRAIVEVKEYKRDCTKATRERMCAVAGHYPTRDLFVYAVKKDEWWRINAKSGLLETSPAPVSGNLNVSELVTPLRFITHNYYGRRYYQSFSDSLFSSFSSSSKRRNTHKK
ncbi:MAG TPA: hypothetical protein VGM08_01640 [Candidatus Saccharimonadales bacterium]|jgi:hypothetical protein